MTHLIVICLLTLLVLTAGAVVRLRSLFAAVMLTGIYSFLGASWMLMLDAPDVAFTEAAVGAGIATVLMLGTLALTTRNEKKPDRFSPLPLLVVLLTGAALVYATLTCPTTAILPRPHSAGSPRSTSWTPCPPPKVRSLR